MATVLVTRPRQEAEALAEILTARGHRPLSAPLLEIRPRADAALELGDVQAVLATSANGVRALATATARRDLPVLAVGPATAAAARALGFQQVATAGGDVERLAALARERLDPAAGPLLHVVGSARAGDLAGDLGASGFAVRRAVLYEAATATALPPSAAAALAAGQVDAVLLFSPRTGRVFVSLAQAAGIAAALAGVSALCLSAAVAAELGGVRWRQVLIAEQAEQAALIALLDRLPKG